jgi:hypothetical protein
MFKPFGFIAPKSLNDLAFQSFDFENTWWRLFQKHVVRTKLDIYVFIEPRLSDGLLTILIKLDSYSMYGTYDWCEIKLKKYWIRVKNVMLRMRSMKEINHTFSWVFFTSGWRTNICYTVFRSQEYAGSINCV